MGPVIGAWLMFLAVLEWFRMDDTKNIFHIHPERIIQTGYPV